jgi:hypothetical protein
MFRARWGRPAFWRWWWQHRLSPEVRYTLRIVALIAAVALLLAGGWLSAARLSSATASGESGSNVVVRTVVRMRTVRSPVVSTAPGRVETKTVRVPEVVTRSAPAQTVAVTNERVVTSEHVVTAFRTNTIERKRLVTVTATQIETQTVPVTVVLTEMQPPATVTVTVRR